MVTKTVIHTAAGTERTTHDPPLLRYFVSVHEERGGKICLGDWHSHALAKAFAVGISAEWDAVSPLPIIDRAMQYHPSISGGGGH